MQRLGNAVAALSKLHRALLLVDAYNVLGALLVQPLADRPPGDDLVLAYKAQQLRFLPVIIAGVHADNWNPLGLGLYDLRQLRLGKSQRQHDPVDMLLDHVGDQLCLACSIRIGLVDQAHVVMLGCRIGALADDVPERVARLPMGYHRKSILRGVGCIRDIYCSQTQTGCQRY